jgi:hypothetical protein
MSSDPSDRKGYRRIAPFIGPCPASHPAPNPCPAGKWPNAACASLEHNECENGSESYSASAGGHFGRRMYPSCRPVRFSLDPCRKFGAQRMRKRIGKLQRQCRRAFCASDASELPTSALVAWCYVRSPRPLATWQREAMCRAVRRWADRVRRDNREWVWRLKLAS